MSNAMRCSISAGIVFPRFVRSADRNVRTVPAYPGASAASRRLSKRAVIGIMAALTVVATGIILIIIFIGGGGNQRNSRVILSLFGLFGVPILAAIILRIFLHRREKDSDFVLPGIIPALARRLSRKQKNDDD